MSTFASLPSLFLPQHTTSPPTLSAHELIDPATTDRTPVSPSTCSGDALDPCVEYFLPSWDQPFAPQQKTAPAAVTAQLWLDPHETIDTLPSPTATGETWPLVSPLPSCPESFAPQQ